MNTYRTIDFLESYLGALELKGYKIRTILGKEELVIRLDIPRTNSSKIGEIKGKQGRNLSCLRQLLRVVGMSEKIKPFLLVSLTDD